MADLTLYERQILSLLVVVTGLLFRWVVIRSIRRRHEILGARERRDISVVHHSTIILIMVFLIASWLPQIEEFALSITAIAVALVIATKELLLCLLGGIIVRTSRAFVIGDWVAIAGRFGEVIERNILTVTLQEIESRTYSYTGRTITMPNSLMFTHTVINQNFLRRYQFHSFSITIEPDAFPIDAEQKLMDRISVLVEPFAETARRYNAMLEKRTGIDIPDAQPSLEFSTNELAKLITTITVFCPTEQIPELEKSMMREFMDWYRANRRSWSSSTATGRSTGESAD